jgi:hypothetical protein
MVIELVPFENEQSPQIEIFEELAIRLVTFFVPASYLTGLIISILAFKSIQYRNAQWRSYLTAIPEGRALTAPLQRGCLRTAPVTHSETIKLY